MTAVNISTNETKKKKILKKAKQKGKNGTKIKQDSHLSYLIN